MLNVSGSMSAKTGTAFWCSVTAASEITVRAGEITSSPGPTPAAARQLCKRRRARVVRDGVANAKTLGEGLFQPRVHRAVGRGAQPGVEHFLDVHEFFFAESPRLRGHESILFFPVCETPRE